METLKTKVLYAFPAISGFYKTWKFIEVDQLELEHQEWMNAWRKFREDWSGFKATAQPKKLDVKIHEVSCRINIGTSKGNIVDVKVNKSFSEIKYADILKIAREKFGHPTYIIGWALNEQGIKNLVIGDITDEQVRKLKEAFTKF